MTDRGTRSPGDDAGEPKPSLLRTGSRGHRRSRTWFGVRL